MSTTKARKSEVQVGLSRYCVDSFGQAEPSVLALHGFTGSGLDFAPLAQQLGGTLHCPNLPGHGGTVVAAEAAVDIEAVARHLAGICDALALVRPVLLGYSMGGRTALTLSRLEPGLAGALVLIGASPGLRAAQDRQARRVSDEQLAGELESSGSAAFMNRWQDLPLLRSQQRMPAEQWREFSERRRAADAAGLALSLRNMGTGSMPSLWDLLGEIRTPTLLVTGEEDLRYTKIARSMASQMKAAQCRVIAGAGHSPHLELPGAVAEVVRDFLQRLP